MRAQGVRRKLAKLREDQAHLTRLTRDDPCLNGYVHQASHPLREAEERIEEILSEEAE